MSTVRLPYGLVDFAGLITEGYTYVDRTAWIRKTEEAGPSLLFVRPRRFGKSLWLDTLRSYYDIRLADDFERLFGSLAIGADPTPLRNRYFVLSWDFSVIAPRGGVDQIAHRLDEYVNGTVERFVSDYREHLPATVEIDKSPVRTLERLLAAIRRTPYRLYLLVDEYDNFANEVLTTSEDDYRRLLHQDGPYKQLFKDVKAMRNLGIERLFITGVSPLVMSDITSGLNICENVYLDPEFNDMCGFTEAEVGGLLERLAAERRESHGEAFAVDDAIAMMRTWYDGYRFAPEAAEPVYNPTLTFYFLKQLQRSGRYPRQMLDSNLAADEGKLRYLGQVPSGRRMVLDLVPSGATVEISHLQDRFTLASLLEQGEQDDAFFASFLYYLGMLTIAGETSLRTLELTPPNLVIQSLYIDQARRLLLPAGAERSAAVEPVRTLLRTGQLEPLLRFIEDKLLPVFSSRDYRPANELTLKTVFLTLLFDDVSYVVQSEPELGRGYADLCLLRRPDARDSELADLLFEFKSIPLKKLGMSGDELRRRDRDELAALPVVVSAQAEAEQQAERYRRALAGRDSGLRLRCFTAIALGFERLLGRTLAPHLGGAGSAGAIGSGRG